MNLRLAKHLVPERGLAALGEVTLLPEQESRLENLLSNCRGSAAWKNRKQVEA